MPPVKIGPVTCTAASPPFAAILLALSMKMPPDSVPVSEIWPLMVLELMAMPPVTVPELIRLPVMVAL